MSVWCDDRFTPLHHSRAGDIYSTYGTDFCLDLPYPSPPGTGYGYVLAIVVVDHDPMSLRVPCTGKKQGGAVALFNGFTALTRFRQTD